MAVDPESWLRMYPEFQLPEDQKKAWLADRQGAIVGADTAKRFGWKVGDRVPLQATIFRGPTAAPGSSTSTASTTRPVKGTDKTQFFFHYDYMNETIRDARHVADQVGWYVIKVNDPDAVAGRSRKKIDAMFANSPTETKTATEKAFVAGFAKQIGNIGMIMQLDRRRGDVHDPAGHGEHHGAVDPRAHQRAGGAQDARLRRRPRAVDGAAGVVLHRAGRRRARAGRRRGS